MNRRRRHFEAKVWRTMFERWGYVGELEIMWPKLARWWPWHPAVIAGAVTVLILVAAWVGR